MNTNDERPVAAAIDIGSNSIKMTVARPDGHGGIEQIDWAAEVVRLGQGVAESGRLAADRINAATETLIRFAARARELGATQMVAVATEATRAAENGADFLARVARETGIEVRVVDGLEEAALTFRGISATTDLTGTVVVADIGGGSTELIVANDGVMRLSLSIPVGSGRLTERLVHTDPPSPDELAASEADADTSIRVRTKAAPLPAGEGVRLILVGGTGEYLARMVPDETAIEMGEVRTVLAKMETLTAAELADAIEAPVARARVLPAGVAVVAALAGLVRPSRIEISRSGVRTGLLLEAFHQIAGFTNGRDAKETRSHRTNRRSARAAKENGDDGACKRDADFQETMKRLIAERWSDVWKSIPRALEGTDIEGVHDVRVASRRLRAAMDVAAPVFPQKWFGRLHRVAKEVTGELGEVRDRDVLLDALQADRAGAPLAEHPGIDRLIDRIEQERVAARAEMERYLRDLMSGPIPAEVARRFGSARGTDDHAIDRAKESA